jgi:hypothetical protein
VAGRQAFREFVLFMQDGVALHDKNGKHIEDPMPMAKNAQDMDVGDGHMNMLDYEDQGQKAFNYKSERFENRLKCDSRIHRVMNSCVHNSPATPMFMAYTNDPVRIRLLMPADKPRNHAFVLHGHVWRQQYTDPFSDIVAAQGPLSVGNVLNIELEEGANMLSGDYAYRSGAFRWDVEQGMWGIFRIYDRYKKWLAPINGNRIR